MALGTTRPRSSTSASGTSNRPRPVSRASTTSVNTTTEASTQAYQYVFQSSHNQPEQPTGKATAQYTPEEMITRSEEQLTNPNQTYVIDPSLEIHNPQSRAMSVDTAYRGARDASKPPIHHFHSFDGKENQTFPSIEENKVHFGSGMVDGQKKLPRKGNASSQANDQELRRLYQENCHRNLKDVAVSVLANERGPGSEKTKQIFAMNWLSKVCKRANTSVPRNRVYTHYAQRCGTERVPLLNHASFGKLVRIIFPDIQTRRLGMRGESKYHYVDLALIEDQSESQHLPEPRHADNPDGAAPHSLLARSQPGADTADFPSPNITFKSNHARLTPRPRMEAEGYLFLDRALPSINKGPSRPNMISRRLKFPTYSEHVFPDDAPIQLPDMQCYIPAGTDPDAAAALRALYRSHCVSVIDCVRFCKEKSFWHHFISFHGTLTVPVQKLFAHPDIAPWIRECDWLMYQKMIQFVSPLALQVMPELVTNAFQSISDNLGRHILNIFSSHPPHVRDAKHGPAVIFAGLLSRLLRVNAASHAAAHILGNDATRNQMWHDWVYHVKPTIVAETCLPGVGYSRTIQILTNDLRDLLSPLGMTSYPGMQQIYATTAHNSSNAIAQFSNLDDSSTSSVLDRWINFLQSLPSRFPGADARTLLHCVSDVGTAALRDITMATAVSFGQWTVTKVWVDEMMQWLAEKGGFLENVPSSMEMRPKKRTAHDAGFETSVGNDSRPMTGTGGALSQQGPYGSNNIGSGFQPGQSIISQQQAAGSDAQSNSQQYPGQNYVPYHPSIQSDNPSQMSEYNPPNHHQHLSAHDERFNRHQQPKDEVETNQQKAHAMEMAPTTSAHTAKGNDFDANDDSGIGLDLELPQQNTPIRLADYGGFVTTTSNSDPADVVVC
ncbi:MAG: hypothetical protein Q9163_001972 [Psora crenata]